MPMQHVLFPQNPYNKVNWDNVDTSVLNTPIDLRPKLGEFQKGLYAFGDEMQAMGYGLAGLGAQALQNVTGPSDTLTGIRDWGLEGYNRNIEESTWGRQAPKVARLEDIGKTGGFGDWAAYQLGKGLPMLGSMAATSGAGALVGRGLVSTGVKEALKREVGSKALGKVLTQEAKDVAAGIATQAAKRGAVVGGLAGSFGMEGGLAYGEQVASGATPENAVKSAIAVGGINAALEFLPVYAVAKKIGMAEYAKKGIREAIFTDGKLGKAAIELARRATGGAVTGAAAEGVTEGLQELVNIAGERWAKNDPIFSKLSGEDISRALNAAAAGGLVGGVAGGAGATVKGPEQVGPTPETETPTPETAQEPQVTQAWPLNNERPADGTQLGILPPQARLGVDPTVEGDVQPTGTEGEWIVGSDGVARRRTPADMGVAGTTLDGTWEVTPDGTARKRADTAQPNMAVSPGTDLANGTVSPNTNLANPILSGEVMDAQGRLPRQALPGTVVDGEVVTDQNLAETVVDGELLDAQGKLPRQALPGTVVDGEVEQQKALINERLAALGVEKQKLLEGPKNPRTTAAVEAIDNEIQVLKEQLAFNFEFGRIEQNTRGGIYKTEKAATEAARRLQQSGKLETFEVVGDGEKFVIRDLGPETLTEETTQATPEVTEPAQTAVTYYRNEAGDVVKTTAPIEENMQARLNAERAGQGSFEETVKTKGNKPGQPFSSARTAQNAAKRAGLTEYQIVPEDGGFVIKGWSKETLEQTTEEAPAQTAKQKFDAEMDAGAKTEKQTRTEILGRVLSTIKDSFDGRISPELAKAFGIRPNHAGAAGIIVGEGGMTVADVENIDVGDLSAFYNAGPHKSGVLGDLLQKHTSNLHRKTLKEARKARAAKEDPIDTLYSKSDKPQFRQMTEEEAIAELSDFFGSAFVQKLIKSGMLKFDDTIDLNKAYNGKFEDGIITLNLNFARADEKLHGTLLHESSHSGMASLLGKLFHEYAADIELMGLRGNAQAAKAAAQAEAQARDIMNRRKAAGVYKNAPSGAAEADFMHVYREEIIAYYLTHAAADNMLGGVGRRLVDKLKAKFSRTIPGRMLNAVGLGFEFTPGIAAAYAQTAVKNTIALGEFITWAEAQTPVSTSKVKGLPLYSFSLPPELINEANAALKGSGIYGPLGLARDRGLVNTTAGWALGLTEGDFTVNDGISKDGVKTLRDILDSPKLFDAIPQAGDIKVKFTELGDQVAVVQDGTIYLSQKFDNTSVDKLLPVIMQQLPSVISQPWNGFTPQTYGGYKHLQALRDKLSLDKFGEAGLRMELDGIVRNPVKAVTADRYLAMLGKAQNAQDPAQVANALWEAEQLRQMAGLPEDLGLAFADVDTTQAAEQGKFTLNPDTMTALVMAEPEYMAKQIVLYSRARFTVSAEEAFATTRAYLQQLRTVRELEDAEAEANYETTAAMRASLDNAYSALRQAEAAVERIYSYNKDQETTELVSSKVLRTRRPIAEQEELDKTFKAEPLRGINSKEELKEIMEGLGVEEVEYNNRLTQTYLIQGIPLVSELKYYEGLKQLNINFIALEDFLTNDINDNYIRQVGFKNPVAAMREITQRALLNAQDVMAELPADVTATFTPADVKRGRIYERLLNDIKLEFTKGYEDEYTLPGIKEWTPAEDMTLYSTSQPAVDLQAHYKQYEQALANEDLVTAQRLVNEVAVASGLPLLDTTDVGAYSIRRKPAPQKTVTRYKAFRVKGGKLYPLYVSADTPLPMGVWLDAKDGGLNFAGKPTTGLFMNADGVLEEREYTPRYVTGGTGTQTIIDSLPEATVKKLRDAGFSTKYIARLAYRPGWHLGSLPYNPQGAGKKDVNYKKGVANPDAPYAHILDPDVVIAEVEVAADKNHQAEYERTAVRTKKGDIKRNESGLRHIPEDGYYDYTTNSSNDDLPGTWSIAGSIRVKRLISPEEANAIMDEAGVPQQKRWGEPFDAAALEGITTASDQSKAKLADTITYDADGKPIPLSKRFDPMSNSPLYSMSIADLTAADKRYLNSADFQQQTNGAQADFNEALYSLSGLYTKGKHGLFGDPANPFDLGSAQRAYLNYVDMFATMEDKNLAVKDAYDLAMSKKGAKLDEINRRFAHPLRELISKSAYTTKQVNDWLAARHIVEDNVNRELSERASMQFLLELMPHLNKADKKLLKTELTRLRKGLDAQGNPHASEKDIRIDAYNVMEQFAPREQIWVNPITAARQQATFIKWTKFKTQASGMWTPEVDAQGNALPGQTPPGPGAGVADAVALYNASRNDATMMEAARLMDGLTTHQLDLLLDGKLITGKDYARMRADKPFYVPLRREAFDYELPFDRSNSSGPGRGVSNRFGYAEQGMHPIDIVQTALANAQAAASAAQKNLANNFLYEQVMRNRADWATWFTARRVNVKNKLGNNGFAFHGQTPALNRDDIVVWRNGARVILSPFRQNQRAAMFAAAVNSLGAEQQSAVGKLMNVVNSIVRFTAISASPMFLLANSIRDPLTAAYNMQASEAGEYTKDIYANYGKAFKALWQTFVKEDRTPGVRTAMVERYENAGGRISFIESLKPLDTSWSSFNAQVTRRKTVGARTVLDWVDKLENLNIAIENVMRLATFDTLVDKQSAAMSARLGRALTQAEVNNIESKAARIAKDLTTNFNRKGFKSSALGTFYLFFNATVQGNVQVIKNLYKSRKLQLAVAGTLGFSILLDSLGRAFSDDDDWDKIPLHEKERNIIFPFKIGGEYPKIPAPWVYNIVWRLGGLISETAAGVRPAGAAGADLLAMAASALNPLGGQTQAQILSPTALDPLVQVIENRDFSGNLLRPENFPGASEKPDSELYWSTAPQLAIDIARELNEFTGGNASESGWIDISPSTLTNFAQFFTGGLGRFGMDTIGATKAMMDGDLEAKQVPILKQFTTRPTAQITTQSYHERVAKVEGAVRAEKLYREGGRQDPEMLQSIRTTRAAELRMAEYTKDVERQVKSLNQRYRVALQRGDKDRAEMLKTKREQIQAKYVERFNERVGW